LRDYEIAKIDPNFRLISGLPEEISWHSCQEAPIQVSGLAVCQGQRFWRLPGSVSSKISENVDLLAKHTAGGRLRFRTDSPYVALQVRLLTGGLMPHMPLSGKSGCDIYLGSLPSVYKKSAFPADESQETYEALLYKAAELEEVTVNLPLYNGVKAVQIGISPQAQLAGPTPYALPLPIVYYGSSITQGGCASRPGNSYQAILTRRLNVDHLNLGFSGSAKGEPAMAQYIAGLAMSAFVLDYDHNALTREDLAATHERFFQIVSARQPELPVIMVSKPDFETVNVERDYDARDSAARREIIRRTYEHAKAAGYENVWFVDGEKLFGACGRDSCTVDGTHPNDLGFMRMAESLEPILRQALRL
jgi:lysophospholipase L1-like esterase